MNRGKYYSLKTPQRRDAEENPVFFDSLAISQFGNRRKILKILIFSSLSLGVSALLGLF